ncbi:hypothetical protein GGX14DRAFT_692174 [Mycena pura]|uniref:Transmembrane protein n=1 Tax=Mycena pura TaxID=153505 RepID=A0AAD7E5Y0_9AGAR|nr:hypothetical protein GGX14DRAFT_692174 [Mycena pura]
MAKLNVTIDDSSPLITYQGDWTQNATLSDAYRGTYSYTESQNASATVVFMGNWIAVNGSRNPSHGNYKVTLDGMSYQFNGWASEDTPFTESLFTSPALRDGNHTLIISNDGWTTLDIDSISWSCNLGPHNASNSSLLNVTTDDSAPAFTWLPQGSWNMNPNLTSFSESTGHSTSQVNASVNYTFSGNRDAVSIYGTTGPGNSRYSVSRADQPRKEFTANRSISSSQVLLYFGQNFGPGMNHTVTLVNETPGLLQIDYAVVHTANVSRALSQPSSSQSSPSPTGTPILPADLPPHKGISAGAIAAAGSIAALIFVLLLVAVWLLLRRNKTLWMRLQRGYMVQSQFDVYSPPNGITPLIYSDSSGARARKADGFPANDDESFEAGSPLLDRAVTMQSEFSASTLVADAGSDMTQVNQPHGLKPVPAAASCNEIGDVANKSLAVTATSVEPDALVPFSTSVALTVYTTSAPRGHGVL